MIYCDDTECKHYSPAGCTATVIHHSTDRFCVTGRRKPKSDTAEMMKAKPIDFKRCERDVGN